MRIGLLLVLAASSGAVAWAQAPADVTVTLHTAHGKTQFRLGEVVPVELVFQSSGLRRYQFWEVPMRRFMGNEFDRFSVEPEEGVRVDPPLVIFSEIGLGQSPVALEGAPVTLALTLNDWMAFRKPGHFRIAVVTKRVLAGQSADSLTLRSNSIEIDEVTPEPGWSETQVSRASAILRGEFRGNGPDGGARALRFLGTLDAAKALVWFHLYGSPGAQYELVKGLRESPYQQEIIEELGAALADPDAPIVQPPQVRSTLDSLKAIASNKSLP